MSTAVKVPPIKIQGIKTKLVPFIRGSIAWDGKTGRWIEPFMGSGVVGFNFRPIRAEMADSNPHIVKFYSDIQTGEITGRLARQYLQDEGSQLLKHGESHYYAIRERFNAFPTSLDFLFLNRACFNGVMRFNGKGRFNVPFCRKPDRFRAAYVTKISNQIDSIAGIIAAGDYRFHHRDWKATFSDVNADDFVYADPPYAGRHTDYFNRWDELDAQTLNDELKSLGCGFALSTWLGNKYRQNDSIKESFFGFDIRTESHFYHVGSREELRNEIIEALVLKPGFGTEYIAQSGLKTRGMEHA